MGSSALCMWKLKKASDDLKFFCFLSMAIIPSSSYVGFFFEGDYFAELEKSYSLLSLSEVFGFLKPGINFIIKDPYECNLYKKLYRGEVIEKSDYIKLKDFEALKLKLRIEELCLAFKRLNMDSDQFSFLAELEDLNIMFAAMKEFIPRQMKRRPYLFELIFKKLKKYLCSCATNDIFKRGFYFLYYLALMYEQFGNDKYFDFIDFSNLLFKELSDKQKLDTVALYELIADSLQYKFTIDLHFSFFKNCSALKFDKKYHMEWLKNFYEHIIKKMDEATQKEIFRKSSLPFQLVVSDELKKNFFNL